MKNKGYLSIKNIIKHGKITPASQIEIVCQTDPFQIAFEMKRFNLFAQA